VAIRPATSTCQPNAVTDQSAACIGKDGGHALRFCFCTSAYITDSSDSLFCGAGAGIPGATVERNGKPLQGAAAPQRCLELGLRGEATSSRAIAKSVGKSKRYVSRIIRAAFLIPDVVEPVLRGRQPAQLTLREVMKQLH
jgi:hypothetical protein